MIQQTLNIALFALCPLSWDTPIPFFPSFSCSLVLLRLFIDPFLSFFFFINQPFPIFQARALLLVLLLLLVFSSSSVFVSFYETWRVTRIDSGAARCFVPPLSRSFVPSDWTYTNFLVSPFNLLLMPLILVLWWRLMVKLAMAAFAFSTHLRGPPQHQSMNSLSSCFVFIHSSLSLSHLSMLKISRIVWKRIVV